MIGDRRLVPDPQSVVDRFAPEFERLLLATTVGALAVKERKRTKGSAPAAQRTGRGKKRRRVAGATGTT
jgi:hypothetical protein